MIMRSAARSHGVVSNHGAVYVHESRKPQVNSQA